MLTFVFSNLLSSSMWPGATLQAVMPENGVTFGLHLACCISMTGYIVVTRENPLLRQMQMRTAGMQTCTNRHSHIHTIIQSTHTLPPKHNTNRQVHTPTPHICYSGIEETNTIRPAWYNSVVWMGSNNVALWHLNQARWWVSQKNE